jgi:hypothetical protein
LQQGQLGTMKLKIVEKTKLKLKLKDKTAPKTKTAM